MCDASPVDHQPLTVLSYGIGQDSWTILVKLALDPAFRKQYAPGRLLVISADTGNEHPDTYEHQRYTEQFCARHGIEYVHLDADKGYHSGPWQTLQFYFSSKGNIASKAYNKTCTDNLKIKPIYRFLEDYVEKHYGFAAARKKGLKELAAQVGKIRVLLGIARGEERRVGGEDPQVWQRLALVKEYPLIDIGFNRGDCQDYLRAIGEPVPPPSNCIFCPFKSQIEILWTHHAYPAQYAEWEQHEQNKIETWRAKGTPDESNFGVNGKKLLAQVLAEAKEKYGHMTMAELEEYRMSHGHLCANKF
ncbi:hypothetical protein ACKF11_13170 [Methylobacillus sp. Pita2]|uniref:hypothetical protein n=1 Tax=Methylobacillus sp. Pita2 TaxID=3383245 RepID=UPI0038B516CC